MSEEDLEMISIKYGDFVEIADLLNDVIQRVIEVGDLHTLVEIEHLLDEREEYARQRDVTEKINEIVKESEAFEVMECDDTDG